MNIEKDLITAYCAGYEAAKYDLGKDGLWEGTKNIIQDAKKWLELMFSYNRLQCLKKLKGKLAG